MTTTPQQPQPTAEQSQLIREVAEKVLPRNLFIYEGRLAWLDEHGTTMIGFVSPREHLFICSLAEGKMTDVQHCNYRRAVDKTCGSNHGWARNYLSATVTQRCKAILEVMK